MFTYFYNERKGRDELYLNGQLFKFRDVKSNVGPPFWQSIGLDQKIDEKSSGFFPDFNHNKFINTYKFLCEYLCSFLNLETRLESITTAEEGISLAQELTAQIKEFQEEIANFHLGITEKRILMLVSMEAKVREEYKLNYSDESEETNQEFEKDLANIIETEFGLALISLKVICDSSNIPGLFFPVCEDLKVVISNNIGCPHSVFEKSIISIK